MNHSELIQSANNALDRLYGDTSVSLRTTLEDIEIIIENLQIRCEALKNNIEDEDEEA